jgi:hypothetical protein
MSDDKIKVLITVRINQFIKTNGGVYRHWYVGIAAKPDERVFVQHKVMKGKDLYTFDDALTEDDARAIEKYFHDLGCQGGGGGGDASTTWVYAYLISHRTVQEV